VYIRISKAEAGVTIEQYSSDYRLLSRNTYLALSAQADIDIADEILTAHGEPFNRAGWQYILDTHRGYLPVVIRAVPEGTVVPVSNVLATIENTDPECFWLTTWLETALLRAVWYGTTVSTQSYTIKQVILDYLERTGDPSTIDFKLHDFGARGVSSLESAGIGGAAHLVNFMGTDTISWCPICS
jgi:nicotinamide phosphoribosyltransferase